MSPVLSRSFTDFCTYREVHEKVVDRRVGFETDTPPKGWRWDYRHVAANDVGDTLPCPGIKASSLLGLSRDYWQNGPLSGKDGISLKVEEIVELYANGRNRWVPKIHRGDAQIWRSSTYLFSDDSVVETLDASSIDSEGRSTHTLARELRPSSPLLVTIFSRSDMKEISPWRNYVLRQSFSGLLDSDGNELPTVYGDIIYWDNVDTTKSEFLSFPREEGIFLQFNKYVVEQITRSPIPVDIYDFNDLEYLGTSDESDGLKFYSKYFPVSNDSDLHVYVVNTTTNTWVEYTIVDTFTGPDQVIFDLDLGVLLFGSSTEPTPAPPNDRAIYLSYNATPRIEYEESGYSDYLHANEADVNPLGQSLNKGFIVLSRGEIDIASIVLSTTKPAYRNQVDIYGPVYVGSDYASLLATVYSSTGEVVPNVEVTFQILTSPAVGSIGGSGSSAERRTASDGIARCFYVPPVSVESLGFFVTSLTPGNILTLSSEAQFQSLSDVYTYYVLKDDPWKGKVGADTSKGEIEWNASPPNGRRAVWYKWDPTAINPISGHAGAYSPVRPSLITDGHVLTYADLLSTPDPSSSTINLGAYWVVSDRYIRVIASCYSPHAGRVIWSNVLNLRVEIPAYMKGDYIRGDLNSIPFGWRIKDGTYEVASAIGGATYLCINPVAGPYPIVDVINSETWDPYASNDPSAFWPYGAYPVGGATREFASLGFSFTIV